MKLYEDARAIWESAIESALPDAAVQKALAGIVFSKHQDVVLIAVGKAAWQMAKAAAGTLRGRLSRGVVITKHGHGRGDIPPLCVYEAGHPVPDGDTLTATRAALDAVRGLSEQDCVLFLVSGGGSALFEMPAVPLEELQEITACMLRAGLSITEMNTIRKRLSLVKGGRFAEACLPAHVYAIVLSDIIGDPLDMIASGPAYPDSATKEDAKRIIQSHGLPLPPEALARMDVETPKQLSNVTTLVTGSVRQLCASAEKTARALGYRPILLTDCLACEAREAGAFLGAVAKTHQDTDQSLAFIAGGETVVHVRGKGRGGRNQELALAAADALKGCRDTCVFSVGSDGTDGPTDAAGGYADENTARALAEQGLDLFALLNDNDAYRALQAAGGLIITGPTGTNVNDVSVLLIRR